MKAVHNKTSEPLRVPLRGGKILHLGPGQTGQIADDAVQSPSLRRLIDSGSIVVDGQDSRHGEFGESQGPPRESPHGHVHGNKVFPSGNRGG